MTPLDHALYALAWASFAVGHSILAGDAMKAAMAPLFGRGYRLVYNGVALIHIGAVWALGKCILAADVAPFERPLALVVLQIGLAFLGAVVLLWALSGYDRGRFVGTAQLKDQDAPDDEPLRISGLNKHVRHPLYAGAILLLAGLIADPFSAATAIWGSLYFIFGGKIEERRLHARYGAAYAEYVARTPMLIPFAKRR